MTDRERLKNILQPNCRTLPCPDCAYVLFGDEKYECGALVKADDIIAAGFADTIPIEYAHETAERHCRVLADELKAAELALELVLNETIDEECPYDHNMCEWTECSSCIAQSCELYNDRERDLNCWKKYFKEQAEQQLKEINDDKNNQNK